jgi:RNA recognition motif-containing protein
MNQIYIYYERSERAFPRLACYLTAPPSTRRLNGSPTIADNRQCHKTTKSTNSRIRILLSDFPPTTGNTSGYSIKTMSKRNTVDSYEQGRSRKKSRITPKPNLFSETAETSSVYVGNLSYDTSWQDLKDHMRKAGNVDSVSLFVL